MLIIRNGQVHTMTGDVIEGGDIAVEDGKIVEIGVGLPVPEGAQVLEAKGRWVQPGFIDAHSHLGVTEQGLGFEGTDHNESVAPSTPHVRALDGINPEDPGFRDALEAGITAAWITPGSANIIGGQATTCRTWGETADELILEPYSALKGALGENPKRVFSGKGKMATRMGAAGIFRNAFYEAKNYMRKQEAAEGASEMPDFDVGLEAIGAVLRKEVPMRIHAHRRDDIMTAVRLAREFDFRLIIEHCTEGSALADRLASEPRLEGVTVGPTLSPRSKVETAKRNWQTAGQLQRAGIRTCVTTDHPVTPIEYLPLCAALCAKAGMSEAAALRAITIDAATLCGVADRVGSLAVGKEADIAIFTGHPFDIRQTQTVATIVAGQVAYRNAALETDRG